MSSEFTAFTDSCSDHEALAECSQTLEPTNVAGSVYLAYPLHMHNTPRARRYIRLAQRRFPNAEILPACDQFSSNADWLRRWPLILPTITAVCVVSDEDGWIGKGVWVELYDALAIGLPVFVLTNKRVHPWDEVMLIESDGRDWRRYARLHLASYSGDGTDA